MVVGAEYSGEGIPAVRNKVLGVLTGLQAAGARPRLVSTIGDRKLVSPIRLLHAGKAGGFDAVQVYAPGRAVVRRMIAMVSLLIAAVWLARRGDRVILYNFFPEYILAAIWLRLAGIPCIIDIEDAPRKDEPGARGVMVRWSFWLLRGISVRRYLIVSDKLARELELSDYLTVYGVASHFTAATDRSAPFSRSEVRINLGGALVRETGVELFIAALRVLLRKHGDQPLHFFVTGHVPPGLFDELAMELNTSPAIRLTVAANLDFPAYRALLDTMDVGLCLKLPSTQMGQTTFPSKVVEIAAIGLLLISTQVSDVPLIFDGKSAILLNTEDPTELAATLASLPGDRDAAAKRARRGQQLVTDRFSALAVGTAIRSFLDF